MKNSILTLAFAFFTFMSFAQNNEHQLSSHILDVSQGKPATGVTIQLEKYNPKNKKWSVVDKKVTDNNGRVPDFLPADKVNTGIYKLTYFTQEYFQQKGTESFYPFIDVIFEIKDENHYHVPITLSAFGYSTYRGN